MFISPFSSLFFPGARKAYGRECDFTQFFSAFDTITIQVIRTSDEARELCLLTRLDDAVEGEANEVENPGGLSQFGGNLIIPETYPVGANTKVDMYTISNLYAGFYQVTIGEMTSEPFEVTSDGIDASVKIEYSPAGNSARKDVVPVLGEERVFFTVRFPGGFKPDGYDFSIDNEQFTSQTSDIVELYSRESMQETLTIGWGRGVPIWFGQMLNRLLTCKYVYIDGFRYARFESSVPEKQQTGDNTSSFILTQKLQRINHLEPIKS